MPNGLILALTICILLWLAELDILNVDAHPFSDDNGRIRHTIIEHIIARSEALPFSLSRQIEADKKPITPYYKRAGGDFPSQQLVSLGASFAVLVTRATGSFTNLSATSSRRAMIAVVNWWKICNDFSCMGVIALRDSFMDFSTNAQPCCFPVDNFFPDHFTNRHLCIGSETAHQHLGGKSGRSYLTHAR